MGTVSGNEASAGLSAREAGTQDLIWYVYVDMPLTAALSTGYQTCSWSPLGNV